ncbi:hypothetical protein AB0D84_02135 [Streptomyces sp. NPDC048193]|uniref:hypothetical protein n=1 Tax=unclassified Streptomyces TaxID=2593676 RepID=UPI00341BA453
MSHVDAAHLVELALGNGVAHDDARALEHIAGCERCRDELRLMTRLVTAARSVEEADLPAAPPGRVWRRITRELAGDSGPAARPAREVPAVPAGPDRPRRSPGAPRAPGRRSGPACCLLAGALIAWWRIRRRRPRAPGASALPAGRGPGPPRLSRRRGRPA